MEKLVEFVREHKRHPVTGNKMTLMDVIQINFSRDSKKRIICPVSLKELNDNVKIAAIKTSKNVFSYETIMNLNRKAKYFRDLINSKNSCISLGIEIY